MDKLIEGNLVKTFNIQTIENLGEIFVNVNSTPLSVIKHHNGEQIFSVWQILAMFRQNKVKELRFIL
jgi:hypothetical protein